MTDFYELLVRNCGGVMNYEKVVESIGGDLKIVVVGANDGKINDPLFDLMRARPELASLLLIEPQRSVAKILEENYSFHPRVTIATVAVGPEGNRTLYCVTEEVWNKVDVPYANNNLWPAYRAPSGIASFDREHVADWLGCFLNTGDAEDFIEGVEVRVRPLTSIIEDVKFPSEIDVLQVDAEGFDDTVIYNSSIDQVQPSIIYYEENHLSEDRARCLRRFLVDRLYRLSRQGDNMMAMKL